jgi:hypothetical protein
VNAVGTVGEGQGLRVGAIAQGLDGEAVDGEKNAFAARVDDRQGIGAVNPRRHLDPVRAPALEQFAGNARSRRRCAGSSVPEGGGADHRAYDVVVACDMVSAQGECLDHGRCCAGVEKAGQVKLAGDFVFHAMSARGGW